MAIKVQEICFSYGDVPVLKNISFDVSRGEFVSLIGPNGSGKTTLLKVLIRVLTPQKGKVLIFDRDIKSYSRREIARLIGFVPQDNTFAFPYTSLEVVLMGRTPYLKGIGFEIAKMLKLPYKLWS
jgi:iron complex transport system ATP-binding protein